MGPRGAQLAAVWKNGSAAAGWFRRSIRYGTVALCALLGVVCVPVVAAGAAVTVRYASPDGSGTACSGSDPCSLAEALAASASTDTVELAAGTYVGHYAIGAGLHDVTVKPETTGSDPVLTGSGTGVVFTVNTGATATLEGVTVTGGAISGARTNYGGGIRVLQSTLILEDSTVSGNTQGGIYVTNATLTVEGSTIASNTAYGGVGGGIYAEVSTLTVDASTVSGNVATTAGGGIAATQSDVTVDASTVSGNDATAIHAFGGGIVIVFHSQLSVDASTIAGNSSADTGGGIESLDSSSVTVESSTVSGNTAVTGGDTYVEGSTFTMAASVVADAAAHGGDCAGGGSFVNAGDNVADETGCGFSATIPTPATLHSVVAPSIDNYLGSLGSHGGSLQTVPLLRTPVPATRVPDPAVGIPTSASLAVGTSAYRPCTSVAENGVSRATPTGCDAGAYELARVVPSSGGQRIFGESAAATAAAELEAAFPASSGRCPGSPGTRPVLLASDAGYADALASAYLASDLRTGTLLTTPGAIPAATLEAIREEGISRVVVVGGSSAVTTAVVDTLEHTRTSRCGGAPSGGTIAVTRIGGADAYATARDLATTPAPSAVGTSDLAGAYGTTNAAGGTGRYNLTAAGGSSAPAPGVALRTAILATGTGFDDAEAAGALSYADHLPLLLTTPKSLAPTAAAAIGVLSISQVVVMGGPLAVSGAVTSQLEALGVSVLRIAGRTASATADELAGAELGATAGGLGFGWRPTGGIVVARGDAWSDALCGAAVAAHGGSGASPEPLLLTQSPTVLGSALKSYLAQVGASGVDRDGHPVASLTVLGGPLAVARSALSSMEAALAR